jgi:hypothetical protein
MLEVAISIVAVVAGGLAVDYFTAGKGRFGYQDEHGFHVGAEARKSADDPQSGNPS